MSDGWVAWYGYRSVILRSNVHFIAQYLRPTGSNMYMIKKTDLTKLPPSHVLLTIRYATERLEDIAVITENMKERINEFLTARGSFVQVVDDILYDGNNTYTAVFDDGTPITLPVESLTQLRATIEAVSNVNGEVISEGKSPCSVFNEAPIVRLSVPTDVKGNLVLLEYIAKCAFIFAASSNQWLKPYANRIGWKSVDSIGRSIASIIVPYFDDNDIGLYEDFLEETVELPKSIGAWKEGHLRLSDNRWYPMHPSILEFVDANIRPPIAYSTVIFKNRGETSEYNVQELIGKTAPEYDWRLLNLARVWNEVCDGLLPFKEWYPVVHYTDAVERISVWESEMGKAVVLNPGNYMLGLFPPTSDSGMLEKEFREYWEDGYVLTNHGHFAYKDAYTAIDEMDIVFIGRERE